RGIGHAPLPARGRSADALPARAGKPFASGRGPPPHGLAHALAAVEGELRAAPAHRAHHLSHLGLRLGDGGGGLPDALPLALARGVTRLGAAETKAALQDPGGAPREFETSSCAAPSGSRAAFAMATKAGPES